MMRFSVVLRLRVVVSALGWILVAAAPLAAAQEGTDKRALAESVIAREEAASERAFDPSFRAKAKELLAGLPLANLLSQTGENGLGLNTMGDTQADLVYTPVTPCRIFDTRLAGGTLSPGVPRSFKVTGDTTSQGGANCGIPFGPATSAMINFVAVSPTGKGNMTITPYGQAMPLASFINFSNTAGTNLANGLAVAICNPSAATCTYDITIQANNSAVDLVADVQGYYRNVSAGGIGTALLADAAVTAAKLAAGSVGTTQIADDSVTSAKIDPTTVQARVSGTCGPTGAIQAVNQDGTVACGSGMVTGAQSICYYTGVFPNRTCNALTLLDGNNYELGSDPDSAHVTAATAMTCAVTANVAMSRTGAAATGTASLAIAYRNITSATTSTDGCASTPIPTICRAWNAPVAGIGSDTGSASKTNSIRLASGNSYRFGCHVVASGDWVGATSRCSVSWTCQ